VLADARQGGGSGIVAGDGRRAALLATQPHDGRPPVLVVEDDVGTRELLRAALEGEGLVVATAADGQAALRWLSRQRPAVLVLDLTLPDARGEDIARAAHARYGAALPVLVVTAVNSPHERADAAGSLVYLAKPFDLATLLGLVRALLAPAGSPLDPP
jgi:DNA-binding response OmpR family regulator